MRALYHESKPSDIVYIFMLTSMAFRSRVKTYLFFIIKLYNTCISNSNADERHLLFDLISQRSYSTDPSSSRFRSTEGVVLQSTRCASLVQGSQPLSYAVSTSRRNGRNSTYLQDLVGNTSTNFNVGKHPSRDCNMGIYSSDQHDKERATFS